MTACESSCKCSLIVAIRSLPGGGAAARLIPVEARGPPPASSDFAMASPVSCPSQISAHLFSAIVVFFSPPVPPTSDLR